MYLIILLLSDGILGKEVLKTIIFTRSIVHLSTSRFYTCFCYGHACFSSHNTTCRSFGALFCTEKVCLGLSQSQSEFRILNDDESITLLHLLKIGKTHLTNETLYTATLRHYILTYSGIIGKFAATEMHKLTNYINCSAQKTKHDECII